MAILSLLSTTAAAQGGAGIYRTYPETEINDTRAPQGYKPFYISHYGRHGSRYLEKKDQNSSVCAVLAKSDQKGLLTPAGKALLRDLREFGKVSDGRYGQLSAVGEEEQQALGKRMAKRFAPVFDVKSGKVVCVSSTASRCIMSMTNLTSELKASNPSLDFSFLCGERYQRYIIAKDFVDTTRSVVAPYVTRYFTDNFDYDAFMGRYFIKIPKAPAGVEDRMMFIRTLLCNASDVACTGEGPDLLKYFTDEERRAAVANYDVYLYGNFCNSAPAGHLRLRDAVVLVKDIVDRADASLGGNGVVADIRYGHDSAMMTLLSLVGIRGFEMSVMPCDAPAVWCSADAMPMSSNLQIVFYRKRSGDAPVLVKLLFNEKEVAIPALGDGPYYSWEALRGYLTARMEYFSGLE